MRDNKRKILLLAIAIVLVVCMTIGVTYAYMKATVGADSDPITKVEVKSCAKIRLLDTDSTMINLSNTYPISDVKGMQTTPYTFKIDSTCENMVGFNLYFTTISTNTLNDSNIHYAITAKDSNTKLIEGILGDATDGSTDFSSNELTQLDTTLNLADGATRNSIYKVYSEDIKQQGEKEYDLYLWVDEDSDNTSMNQSFSVGVSIKAYDRSAKYIGELCVGEELAQCIKDNYETESAIIYHDGQGDYTNAGLEAGDNSYRYTGASEDVDNYVCFGSDSEVCPDDNLYRIIGVFGTQIKVIKNTSIGDYYWSGSDTNQSNEWASSTLNNDILNNTYLNSLSFASSIAESSGGWQVGGNTFANIAQVNAKTVYTNEITSSADSTTSTNKIGLIYVSDYMYGASSTYWSYKGYDTTTDYKAAKSSNWLATGITEWTISRNSDDTGSAFIVNSTGNVNSSYVYNQSYAVRPVFCLASSVTLQDGMGTKSNPYRIA